jgi:hypothetical protein
MWRLQAARGDPQFAELSRAKEHSLKMEERGEWRSSRLAKLARFLERYPLGVNGRTYSVEYQKLSQERIPEAVRVLLNKKFGAELIAEGDTGAPSECFIDALRSCLSRNDRRRCKELPQSE